MSIKKSRKTFLGFSSIVRLIGLEPTRRETPDPKSGASTNFATGAKCNPLFALLPCKDSANRAKKKINLVYFLFFALLNNPSEVPPILFKDSANRASPTYCTNIFLVFTTPLA